MKKSRIFCSYLLIVFLAFTANCGGGGDGGGNAVTKQVSVTDPTGDVAAGSKGDLTAASIEQVGDNLQITIRLAPGEFDPLVSDADVVIDIDMDPKTGYSTNAGLMGVEYVVEMGSACLQNKAVVHRYNSATAHWDDVGQYDVTFLADGMVTTIPISVLNGYTGKFSFWFESSREVASCGYTGRIDSMPNLGTSPGVFQ